MTWPSLKFDPFPATNPSIIQIIPQTNIKLRSDVLKAKGCHYQLIYAKGVGHTDHNVIAQTLPQALEFLWKDFKPVTK